MGEYETESLQDEIRWEMQNEGARERDKKLRRKNNDRLESTTRRN